MDKFIPGKDYRYEEIESEVEKECHHMEEHGLTNVGQSVIRVLTDEGDTLIFVFTSASATDYYYTCVYNEFADPKYLKSPN